MRLGALNLRCKTLPEGLLEAKLGGGDSKPGVAGGDGDTTRSPAVTFSLLMPSSPAVGPAATGPELEVVAAEKYLLARPTTRRGTGADQGARRGSGASGSGPLRGANPAEPGPAPGPRSRAPQS